MQEVLLRFSWECVGFRPVRTAPAEACDADDDCATGFCVFDGCRAGELGDACVDAGDCGEALTCTDNQCS